MFGVPVALSSDDKVSRGSILTHEYVRAVQSYDLHYADLKRMVRTSMEHSFLPGPVCGARRMPSFGWFPLARRMCRAQTSSLRVALNFSGPTQKAGQQWELERRFRAFEAGL